MHVCLCACLSACGYACVHTCMSMYACMHRMCICMRAMYAWTVGMPACMHARVRACMTRARTTGDAVGAVHRKGRHLQLCDGAVVHDSRRKTAAHDEPARFHGCRCQQHGVFVCSTRMRAHTQFRAHKHTHDVTAAQAKPSKRSRSTWTPKTPTPRSRRLLSYIAGPYASYMFMFGVDVSIFYLSSLPKSETP